MIRQFAVLPAVLAIGFAAGASHAAPSGFVKADANGDNRVSKQEFEMSRLLPAPRRFARADLNKDGFLSPAEFHRTRPFATRRRIQRSNR